MKKLLRIVVAFSVVVISAFIITAVLLTDDKAEVTDSALAGLNDAESVTVLLEQLQASIIDRDNPHTITFTQAQLQSLIAFLERANPKLRGRLTLGEQQSQLQLTYQLPGIWSSRHLNVFANLREGAGFDVSQVSIGSITLSGENAIGLATGIVDWWTDSDIASYAAAQITRVDMSERELEVSLKPLAGLLDKLNALQNGLNVEQDEWLVERTAHYLRFLARYSVNRTEVYNNTSPSLGIYLSAVMQEAIRNPERDAAQENEAALLALTIFAGHHRFGNLVGSVQRDPDKAVSPPHPTLLAGRADLSQHFVISAGLKILSEQGISTAIGEFKELMDRVLGGSGYSFVDLAADLTGIAIAEAALRPESADRVQRLLAQNADEAFFFPRVDDLPEGLDKQRFTQQYGGVDSDAYRAQVSDIEQRVSRLPLLVALDAIQSEK